MDLQRFQKIDPDHGYVSNRCEERHHAIRLRRFAALAALGQRKLIMRICALTTVCEVVPRLQNFIRTTFVEMMP